MILRVKQQSLTREGHAAVNHRQKYVNVSKLALDPYNVSGCDQPVQIFSL